jgi:hypothetical protein
VGSNGRGGRRFTRDAFSGVLWISDAPDSWQFIRAFIYLYKGLPSLGIPMLELGARHQGRCMQSQLGFNMYTQQFTCTIFVEHLSLCTLPSFMLTIDSRDPACCAGRNSE